MNKTLIVLSLFGLVALGVIGGTLIVIFVPDGFGQFTQFIITITAFALTAVVTITQITQLNTKVDNVVHNTNGINKALRDAAIAGGTLDTEKLAELPSTDPQIGV